MKGKGNWKTKVKGKGNHGTRMGEGKGNHDIKVPGGDKDKSFGAAKSGKMPHKC